jgi:hypothetical protein
MSLGKGVGAWGGRRMGLLLLMIGPTLPGLTACRSAGTPAPKGPGTLDDPGRALVGQRRIVRYHGEKKSVSVKVGAVERGSGRCDVAVEVRTATFSPGSARFSLKPIGRPRLEGGSPEKPGKKASCRRIPRETLLVVSGLEGSSAEELTAQVGRILMTPEDYLRAHGARFDRPAGADPREVADPTPNANAAEQRLAQSITARQRRLLAIEPLAHGSSKRTRYHGLIEFVTVVGTDGRLHQPKLTVTLGEHEDEVLRVLPLWRYEPALRGDQPVAVRLRETAVFQIF